MMNYNCVQIRGAADGAPFGTTPYIASNHVETHRKTTFKSYNYRHYGFMISAFPLNLTSTSTSDEYPNYYHQTQ